MEKKIIERGKFERIEVDFDSDINAIVLYQKKKLNRFDIIHVEKSKATEVAKAIDPKYQELEDEKRELEKKLMFLDEHCGMITLDLNWERDVVVKGLEKKLTSSKARNAKLEKELKRMIKTLDKHCDYFSLTLDGVEPERAKRQLKL